MSYPILHYVEVLRNGVLTAHTTGQRFSPGSKCNAMWYLEAPRLTSKMVLVRQNGPRNKNDNHCRLSRSCLNLKKGWEKSGQAQCERFVRCGTPAWPQAVKVSQKCSAFVYHWSHTVVLKLYKHAKPLT